MKKENKEMQVIKRRKDMSERLVFVAGANGRLVKPTLVSFEWARGLSAAQKKKNVARIHEGFLKEYPERKVLEISRYSEEELGQKLSAFHLMTELSDGRTVSVECAFQSGKVFEHGGPYTDLLYGTSMDAKRDERLKNSGKLIGFEFQGESFPIVPKTMFYHWLYINALHKNRELAEELMNYNAFTDIAFNQEKQVNCQAEAAAYYVSLRKLGLLSEALKSKEDFVRVLFGGEKADTRVFDVADRAKKLQ